MLFILFVANLVFFSEITPIFCKKHVLFHKNNNGKKWKVEKVEIVKKKMATGVSTSGLTFACNGAKPTGEGNFQHRDAGH